MEQELVLDPSLQSNKNQAWWLYIFHAASFLLSLGAFSWLPLIVNYVKRPDSAGTFVHSHHTWQIRSFWWYFAWMMLGGFFFFTIIGIPLAWLICTAAWIWKAYRLIKGMVDLNQNRSMPV